MRKIKALLKVDRGAAGYRDYPVQKVENYVIETSLDNDSDPFSIDIGDPRGHFDFLRDRDNEVLVNLYSGSKVADVERLHYGFSDVVSYNSDDRVVSIQGRDFSSIAVDTDAPPSDQKNVFPNVFIRDRAIALGFTKISMPAMSSIARVYTDGSEKEWELWYRLMREKDMWLWTLPDGTLVGNKLNYSDKSFVKPKYHFGHSGKDMSGPRFHVEHVIHSSNKQQRVQRVFMYGETGKTSLFAEAIDPRITAWRRKNLKITLNAQAKNNAELKKQAEDEIFDSIVGAIEFTLVVRDAGDRIKPNWMARINLPEHGIKGVFFIVGVRLVGSADQGYLQEVRFRERNFALSRRVPDAPQLDDTKDTRDEGKDVAPGLGGNVLTESKIPWGECFVRSAKKWHKGSKGGKGWNWDLAMYLGVLLSICKVETSFRNIRTYAVNNNVEGPVWYEKPDPGQQGYAAKLETWKHNFANNIGNPYNPSPNRSAAVGPMQLVTPDYKVQADKFANKAGEYDGGRWVPCANIEIAAKILAEEKGIDFDSTKGSPKDLFRTSQIWFAVRKYYGGPNPEHYSKIVQEYFESTYYQIALAAINSEQVSTVPGGAPFTLRGLHFPAMRKELEKVIRTAMAQLGVGYHWAGGNCEGATVGDPKPGSIGDKGFDCSGLVWYAYCEAGKNLANQANPRPTTYSMIKDGTAVGRDALKPGDLVFFHSLGHMGIALVDDQFIHAPHSGDVVKISSLGDPYYRDGWDGARRIFAWSESPVGPPPEGVKRVMIQAGHDTGGNADQPYGHAGQSGAAGELEYNKSVRDMVLAHLQADPNYEGISGTAWSASAGETSDPDDDIDAAGLDMLIALHYNRGSGTTGFFFGYTRGATDGRSAAMSTNSAKLADKIAGRIDNISGAPPRLSDNTGFGGSPAGASGWGYYPWGSTLRASPDNINHIPGCPAAVILENGSNDDGAYLDNKKSLTADAVYRGICDYYGTKPLG